MAKCADGRAAGERIERVNKQTRKRLEGRNVSFYSRDEGIDFVALIGSDWTWWMNEYVCECESECECVCVSGNQQKCCSNDEQWDDRRLHKKWVVGGREWMGRR